MQAVPKDITPIVNEVSHDKEYMNEIYPDDDPDDDDDLTKVRKGVKLETTKEVKVKVKKALPNDEGAYEGLSDKDIKAIEKEQAEATEEDVIEEEAPNFKPASDKQKDYIYGTSTSKGIIESHLITKEEVKRIGLVEDLDIEKASKILAWWWGDKDKNIIGEREKREKNPKVGDSDLERRGVLMQEVLDLMKENHIKPAEKKMMYKKYQKDEIIKLTYEELEELKALLENYTPNWK